MKLNPILSNINPVHVLERKSTKAFEEAKKYKYTLYNALIIMTIIIIIIIIIINPLGKYIFRNLVGAFMTLGVSF
jgi:hypothetical protein